MFKRLRAMAIAFGNYVVRTVAVTVAGAMAGWVVALATGDYQYATWGTLVAFTSSIWKESH